MTSNNTRVGRASVAKPTDATDARPTRNRRAPDQPQHPTRVGRVGRVGLFTALTVRPQPLGCRYGPWSWPEADQVIERSP